MRSLVGFAASDVLGAEQELAYQAHERMDMRGREELGRHHRCLRVGGRDLGF